MKEFKRGTLGAGPGGKRVTSSRQTIALNDYPPKIRERKAIDMYKPGDFVRYEADDEVIPGVVVMVAGSSAQLHLVVKKVDGGYVETSSIITVPLSMLSMGEGDVVRLPASAKAHLIHELASVNATLAAKANPYRDARGRFTSKDKAGGGWSQASGRQYFSKQAGDTTAHVYESGGRWHAKFTHAGVGERRHLAKEFSEKDQATSYADEKLNDVIRISQRKGS